MRIYLALIGTFLIMRDVYQYCNGYHLWILSLKSVAALLGVMRLHSAINCHHLRQQNYCSRVLREELYSFFCLWTANVLNELALLITR